MNVQMRAISFVLLPLVMLVACGKVQDRWTFGRDLGTGSHESTLLSDEERSTGQKRTNKGEDEGIARNGGSRSDTAIASRENTLPLETELSPSCGSRGTVITLRIKTTKTASLAIAVSYSNGQNYGNYFVGHADEQGRFTYTWMIPPEAPFGRAQVLVGAGDHSPGPEEYSAYSTGESSTEVVPFRVARSC